MESKRVAMNETSMDYGMREYVLTSIVQAKQCKSNEKSMWVKASAASRGDGNKDRKTWTGTRKNKIRKDN